MPSPVPSSEDGKHTKQTIPPLEELIDRQGHLIPGQPILVGFSCHLLIYRAKTAVNMANSEQVSPRGHQRRQDM